MNKKETTNLLNKIYLPRLYYIRLLFIKKIKTKVKC